MTTPTNVIVSQVASVLAAAGFQRRSKTWYRSAPVGVVIVNVQKSNWGPQYYVNLGVYVSALGSEARPPIHLCHFYARAGSLDRARGPHWAAILDLAKPITDAARGAEIRSLLTHEVLPFLDRLSTTEGLRAAAAGGELRDGMLLRTLALHLGVA